MFMFVFCLGGFQTSENNFTNFFFFGLKLPHILFLITSFNSHSEEYCQNFTHYPPISRTFSLSIIHLVHHLARKLVFPLRQHVILPTHNIKQFPCTTINRRLCPLPAHNSQHSKELCCLSPRPHFPPGFSWHVSFRVKTCRWFKKMYSISLVQCLFIHLLVCLKSVLMHLPHEKREKLVRNHGRMDRSDEGMDVWLNTCLICDQCRTGNVRGQERTSEQWVSMEKDAERHEEKIVGE